jgi:hypothetical protein
MRLPIILASCIALAGTITLGGISASWAQTPDALPAWVEWLVASGHAIEDGRACGLIKPDEVDGMYVAVLMISRADGIPSDKAEKVLRVARDHARDWAVTPEICKNARAVLPAFRGALAPYIRAGRG